VAQLLILTSAGERDVLPALELLGHKSRQIPAQAAALLNAPACDLILLDARTDLSAAKSLCKILVASGMTVPVMLVLTEGGLAAVSADWGVDDVVLVNAGPAEVDARIRLAIGRQATSPAGSQIRASGVVIDEVSYSAKVRGKPLDLTYKEFELLRFLAAHPSHVFTREQLLSEVWGYDYFGGTRTVDVHVRRLRAKLGDLDSLIGTVRNVGYRFNADESAEDSPEDSAEGSTVGNAIEPVEGRRGDEGSVRVLASGDVPWLPDLIERARIADGQPPFSDGSLVELATGERTVLAIGEHAVALVALPDAEFVVDPDARGHGLGTALLEALMKQGKAEAEAERIDERSGNGNGNGTLLVWSHGDHPGARALAAKYGFSAVRTLLHLRADIANSRSAAESGSAPSFGEQLSATISSFRPGVDDAEWLELNALVFAEHPEQGRVTQSDLEVTFAEPWFATDDFLLLRSGGGALIGYCWLKIENGEGEFYVVGVHPNSAGQGLGRVLVEAGLARMLARGIRSAHLYVEAENIAAVHLYRSYGFVDDTIDVQYVKKSYA
jgi:mycothiol synthase